MGSRTFNASNSKIAARSHNHDSDVFQMAT
jgi:hypothetical protein